MFHSDGVGALERMDKTGNKFLKWAYLPCAEEDKDEWDEVFGCYDMCAR